MSVKILYFARLREEVGIAAETFEPPAPLADVKGLREQLIARGAPWSTAFAPGKAVRASVNQDIARDHTPVKAGDEVAFFPPVTGG
jgi:molybdopterin synthase sulfur carrier subunit